MLKARVEILTRGFLKVGVEGAVPWLYTIGLADRTHPELLIAGMEIAPAADLLDRLAERVVRGERMEAGMRVEEADRSFALVNVHPARLDHGLCAVWEAYDRSHHGSWRLDVLQVQIPDDLFCRCHAGRQPRLDLPGGTPALPNRAMRRRGPPRPR